MEMKVKRDQRTDSPWPRKHRKSKCFLILKFFAAKSRRGDFSRQSIAHCKDSQMLVARHGRASGAQRRLRAQRPGHDGSAIAEKFAARRPRTSPAPIAAPVPVAIGIVRPEIG